MKPFGDRLSQLLASTVTSELIEPRSRGNGGLTTVPTSDGQAWGCHAEYLSGTAKWEQWNLEQQVKRSKEFKALGVENFRTKEARALRDQTLENRSICFLHEASRYRGKANYRDAIYLAYGKAVPSLADGFIYNLTTVLTAFSAMAAGYCYARMGVQKWQEFIDDLENRRAISLSPLEVWS